MGGCSHFIRLITIPFNSNLSTFLPLLFSFYHIFIHSSVEPTNTISPINKVSLAGDNSVSFTCESTGSPNLAIEWYHNQNLIAQANGSAISSKYTINSTSLGNGAIHSTLTITAGLKLADSGEVTCVASTQCEDDFGVIEYRTAVQTATLAVVGEFQFHFSCRMQFIYSQV